MKTKNIFAKLFFTGIFILNLHQPRYFSTIYAYSTSNIFSKNDLSNLSVLESNKFLDSIIILSCKDTVINSLEDNCSQALVTLSMNAQTDCSLSNQLNWTYALDLNNDGTINHIGNSSLILQNMAYGTHKVTWIAQNSCGNSETCVQKISVKDGRKPKLVCLDIVGDLVPGGCTLEIFASDFVSQNESFDNCPGPFTYSYDSLGLSTSRIFNINNIGANPVTIFMRDQQNNVSSCGASIAINPNCIPTQIDVMLAAKGLVKGLNGQTKKDIDIIIESIKNPVNIEVRRTKTDINGDFTAVPFYMDMGNYKLYPKYNQELRNGLNIQDIIALQKHLLGTRTLTDPYLLLAADINNSETHTIADLIELKKAVLGAFDSFPNNQSFRFVRTRNLGNTPLGAAGNYEFNYLTPSTTIIPFGFTMVKIGDLDQSYTLNGPSVEERNYPSKFLILEEKQLDLGQEFIIKIANTSEMIGMQGTLDFDPKMVEFQGVLSPRQQQNINPKDKEKGQVSFITEEQTPQIDFVFKTLQKQNLSKTFNLSNALLSSLIVDPHLNVSNLKLAFNKESKKLDFDFYPNPMNKFVNINCDYPSNESGTLNIYSMDGRLVFNKEIHLNSGFNHLTIDLSGIKECGMFVLEIKTTQFIQQKKIFKTN